jgi:hypothetical protein
MFYLVKKNIRIHTLLLHALFYDNMYNMYVGPKKSLWIDLEEKCLRNSKIFFDGVFLSIYSHLFKNLEFSKLYRKKVIGL